MNNSSGESGPGTIKRSTLVIFDFSGTLSLGAVLFAKDKTIRRALKKSGLAGLGLENPETFWKELVEPTWEEGSTTARGYVGVLTDRLEHWPRPDQNCPGPAGIRQAVAHFVRAYFSYSLVDPRWEPAFKLLNSRRDTDTVIATDHYAEATEHIINELHKIDLIAAPLDRALRQEKFFVVNSADLGCHKSTREFWEILKNFLGAGFYRQILLVDDFGFNEQEDFYGGKARALQRRDQVTAILKAVFQTELRTFSFFLEHPPQNRAGLSRAYLEMIEKTDLFLKKHLGEQ